MANCVQCGRQLPGLSFGKKLCQWCVQHDAAQRGEDSGVQRVEAAPWVRRDANSMTITQVLLGANGMVFIAMAMGAGITLFGDPQWNALTVKMGANVGQLTMGGQWWRLLTCVFIHGGLVHFAVNMWCLWNLGRLAESLYGPWTYGVIYLVCGVSASVASLIRNPHVSSVGASGAIFGIAGALLASFYLGEFSLPRFAISGLLRNIGGFIVANLLIGGAMPMVDNAAHVGGLVMGLILGALIAKVAPAQDQPLRRVGVLIIGAVLALSGALWLHQTHAYAMHTDNAKMLLLQRNTDQAIVELETALKQRPNYLPAHFDLARAYAIKGDFSKAGAELRRVVDLDPRDPSGWDFLGYAELEQEHPDQARQAYNQLLKLIPNSADAHFGLGRASSQENKFPEALTEYRKTAEIDPSYQSVYYFTGTTQGELGLYDDAIKSFLKQRDNGDDPDNENALAEAYLHKGMAKEAADAHTRAQQSQEQQ